MFYVSYTSTFQKVIFKQKFSLWKWNKAQKAFLSEASLSLILY